MAACRLGIITGSGSYSLGGFESVAPRDVRTPFGVAHVNIGHLAGMDVVHISRHLEGHRRLSSHVTHQANISALAQLKVDAVLAVTVCGACDPGVELGSLIVFDDLHFLANRLPDGSLCSLHVEPGSAGRGHWIFDRPFSDPLRRVLLDAAEAVGTPARDGGCYGHVDGPRFNSRAEIRGLQAAGVTAVSQTAGPETVLCGEAELPYALLGYATDYANGVSPEPTPVEELVRLVGASGGVFARVLADAMARIDPSALAPVGTHFRFD
jgi:5'-methylthioadenosine phosphorylase